MPAKTNVKPRRRNRSDLGPSAWIAAARSELIKHGILGVKIGRLARHLKVTRGGFYWHFKDRADLLRQLLADWEATTTAPFERALSTDGNGVKEFQAVVDLWVSEKEYSPAFDTAVRDWARKSKDVAVAVHRADNKRIEVLRRIFLDMGYADPEALVRARVAYFHQVGYYALGMVENPVRRRRLVPVYVAVLVGTPPSRPRATGSRSNRAEALTVSRAYGKSNA